MEAHIDMLTDRQARFVFEYLKDQNASAAAERAGYSARSRASQAGELMKIPAVRERIRIEMESLLAELRLSALDLMKERMRAAFFRAGKLFNASGQLLGFEEMEAEVRDCLVISAKWRKGEPEVSFRSPNREPALRALERVHERLEKLNEAHYAALEKARANTVYPAAPGAMPAGMWMGPDLKEAAPAHAVGDGDQSEAPAPATPVDNFAENSQVFSGSANTTAVPMAAEATSARNSAEISQGFSGAPEKPAKPSLLSKALAALTPARKDGVPPDNAPAPLFRSNLHPGAPLIKRRDPELMWGGPRKYTPPEPSPALLEHLARIRHEESMRR